jgi:hypothetical protein
MRVHSVTTQISLSVEHWPPHGQNFVTRIAWKCTIDSRNRIVSIEMRRALALLGYIPKLENIVPFDSKHVTMCLPVRGDKREDRVNFQVQRQPCSPSPGFTHIQKSPPKVLFLHPQSNQGLAEQKRKSQRA